MYVYIYIFNPSLLSLRLGLLGPALACLGSDLS